MKPRTFLDEYPTLPARLDIVACEPEVKEGPALITAFTTGNRKDTCVGFVIKSLRQGRQIVKTLTAALDEWEANGQR